MRFAAALLAAVAFCCSTSACNGSDEAEPATPGFSATQDQRSSRIRARASWARVTNEACTTMQNRLSALGGWDYWAALGHPPAQRRLSRSGLLYGQWLEVKEQGLREIRSRLPEPTSGQEEALASYEEMLERMRDAVQVAELGKLKAYKAAYLQMVVSIQATREAFEKEGAPNICNFPI
jgi:hypothetical protein